MGERWGLRRLAATRTCSILLLLALPCRARIVIPGEPFECSTRFASSGFPLSSKGITVRLLFLERDTYLCQLNPDSGAAHRIRNYSSKKGIHAPLGLVALDERQSPCTLEHKVYAAASMGVPILVMVTQSKFFPRRLDVSSESAVLSNLTLLSVTSECKDRILGAMPFVSMGDDTMLNWREDYLGPHFDVRVALDTMALARQDFLLIPLALVILWTLWMFLSVRRVAQLLPSLEAAPLPRLLSEEFVCGLCCSTDVAKELISNSFEDSDPPSCPICLDPFHTDTKVTILPCGHPYHQDCILPWLTKRQSVCPICKFDLTPPAHDAHARSTALRRSAATSTSTGLHLSDPRLFLRDLGFRVSSQLVVAGETNQLSELELTLSHEADVSVEIDVSTNTLNEEA